MTSGVQRADAGAGPREPRFIPLTPFPGDVQLLLGDPDSAGPFVMRIHELPGTIVPPHTHPGDEHITVVQGTWYFGLGAEYDRAALHQLPVGSYAFAPAGSTMFGWSPDDAVVQVSGTGPFPIHWKHGAVSLATDSSGFRYRRGQWVTSRRGRGIIREGYASGAIIEYEIEVADGHRFMATESELHPGAPN